MMIFDDMCRCGVICTCGGDDWGEELDGEKEFWEQMERD